MTVIQQVRTLCFLTLTLAHSPVIWANEAHEAVAGMSNAKRNATFASFMEKSGKACGSVVRSFFQGLDGSGNAYWNVACSNKRAFAIMINNDATGSTRILGCDLLRAVVKVDCFKKF